MSLRILVVAVIVLAEVLGAHRAALLLSAAVAAVVIGLRLLRWLAAELKRLAAAAAKYAACILAALAIGLGGRHVTVSPAGHPVASLPYAGIALTVTVLIAVAFAAFLAQKMIREARSWRTAS